MELTQRYLEPPDAENHPKDDAGTGASRRCAASRRLFQAHPIQLQRRRKIFRRKILRHPPLFHLVWECSRRLAEVVIENKDCVDLIRQYDREDAFFYCDPPYYDAEDCYAVGFPKEDHQRLHDALLECQGL